MLPYSTLYNKFISLQAVCMFNKKYLFILMLLILFTISSVYAVDNNHNISNNEFQATLQEDGLNNVEITNFNEMQMIENNNSHDILDSSEDTVNGKKNFELDVCAPTKITNNSEISGYKENAIVVSSNSIDATGKINIFINNELKETLYAQTLYDLNFYEITPNDFKE